MIHRSARAAIKLLLAALLPATAQTAWAWDGEGSQNSPYQIKNASDLDQLAANVNSGTTYEGKYFVLTKDIDYSHKADGEEGASTETNYTPIGVYYNDDYRYFKGHFDGNSKTVSGIRIYKSGDTNADMYQGLFGYIRGAEVKNVTLADARITGYWYTGGIVGRNESGTITNCHVLSDVTIHAVASYTRMHGGIVGYNGTDATVSGCTSAASITTTTASGGVFGGVVGYNQRTVRDCLYLGNTIEGEAYVGAIVGNNYANAQNCYYTSTAITGKDENGGTLANAVCALGFKGYGTVTNYGLARTVEAGLGVTIDAIALTGTATDYRVITGMTGDNIITAYSGGGIVYAGKAYCPGGSTVSLTLSNTAEVPLGYRYKYLASAGTLSGGAGNSYTLTMPAKDVTITTALRSTGNRVNVACVDEKGQTQHVDAIALDGTESSLVGGHAYYVGMDINYSNSIVFNIDAFLILGDGCTMTVNTGSDAIHANQSLAIYGQALGTGKLNANGGIFGIWANRVVTINGGNVTASGGTYGIYANELKLGSTNASYHIYANSYNIGTGRISINGGQKLTDADGNQYKGNVSAQEINGKHLYPFISNLNLAANQAPDQNYWTTFYCGHTDYQIDADENACAYTATYEGDQLTLHRLGKAVPKATAVIIVADNDEVSMHAATLDAFTGSNDLRGVDTDSNVADIIAAAAVANTNLAGATPFVLGMTVVDGQQHFGFHRYTATEMPARKAFVLVPAAPGSNANALTRGISIEFGDDATGIEAVEVLGNPSDQGRANDDTWYTIDGRKLGAKPTKKGLYIYKGRKVAIK